jgi:hypothetical protein
LTENQDAKLLADTKLASKEALKLEIDVRIAEFVLLSASIARNDIKLFLGY